MNTARTARGNRLGLALTGILLLLGGGYLVARSLGAFGAGQAEQQLYPTGTADWIHQQRPWLWITIAVVAIALIVVGLRWLLVQLRTDGLNRISLDTDHTGEQYSGRSELPAGALTSAVGAEIDSYPGVGKVHVKLTGKPDRPELRLQVTVDPDADLGRIRRRITDEALAHARTALDTEHLPTQLRLIVGRRRTPERTSI